MAKIVCHRPPATALSSGEGTVQARLSGRPRDHGGRHGQAAAHPTEAATALGIGRSKVYELMQTGQLQSVHIGACRRVSRDALTAFLGQLRTAS